MRSSPFNDEHSIASEPMNPNLIEQAVTALLLRAGEAQRLARCFVYPEPGFQNALLASLDVLSRAAAPDPGLVERLAGLREIWTSMDEEAIRAEYSRLFIAAGGCSLNETSHGPRGLTSAAELADIQGFYRAFGFERSATHPEMGDHVASELEFYAAVLLKLAYATLQDWADQREVAGDGARRFLEAHLGRWLPALGARLRALNAAPPYRLSAEAAAAFVASECRHLAAVPAPLDLIIPLAPTEPEVFTCPVAPDSP
jgi:putative dimethyl sulfoxide reductase chaperone